MKIQVGSRSDVGRAREFNEDSIGESRPADAQERARKGELLLVADGMGGHVSGEIASRLAVDSVLHSFQAWPGGDAQAWLMTTVQQTNAEICARGGASTDAQHDGLARMGTTLVGALLRGNELHIVNVGDSRAYRLRNGRLEQLSRDHSLVADQMAKGLIDAEQARHLIYRNTITRALGQKPTVEVDYFPHTLQVGDVIILCTDGLSGQVQDAEIAAAVLQHATQPDKAAARLVALANQRGGPDNISVIVAQVLPDAPPESAAALTPGGMSRPASKKSTWLWLCALAAAAALLLIALLAIAALAWRASRGAMATLPPAVGTVIPGAATPGRILTRAPLASAADWAAPLARPIAVPIGQQTNELARDLGYSSAMAMAAQNPRQGTALMVSPRPSGLLVVGAARGPIKATGPACELKVTTGERSYLVTCPPGGRLNADLQMREGDLVRVLGLSETETSLRAILVDVKSAQPDAEWINWYTDSGAVRRLWVYTILNKDTVRDVSQYGVQDGDRILVHAQWETDRAQIARNIHWGRLDDDHYTLIR